LYNPPSPPYQGGGSGFSSDNEVTFKTMQLTPEIQEEINQVRQNCGYFFMEGWSILSANGKDTLSFLQTQTTNDALQLQVGKVNPVLSQTGRLA